MLKSKHGCWTCRLRRKRCDEVHPACTACASRNITCHGYGDKPDWMDGGDSEKIEAKRIKKEIQSNLRLKNEKSNRADTESQYQPNGGQYRGDDIMVPLLAVDSNSVHAFVNTHAGTRREISDKITSYREAELLMHYMDYVFPLQFRFHTPDVSGRGWLMWLLVKTGPLYHAALSLSALHQSIYFSNVFGNTYAELSVYHAKALRDLQQFLHHLQISEDGDEKSRQIEVMACGVSLISFELFQGGVSDWQLHLNALISILTSRSSSSLAEMLGGTQETNGTRKGSPHWQQTASSFFITVILWFDLLACASTGQAPRMPYRYLIDSNIVNMSNYMGVQNWAMRAIGDIAALSVWKDNSGGHDFELISQGQAIEQGLEDGLRSLDNISLLGASVMTTNLSTQQNKVPGVTRAFATAALVQLRTVLYGSTTTSHPIRDVVARNIEAMKSIHDEQDFRGLVWPICISGSMAEAAQQPFYESIVKEVLGDKTRDFGNCATILQILTRCWEMRRLDPHSSVRWVSAMAEIGTCLLV
ncbi:fungal-specific transcription factor domain-containing protein [Talaromyces proteolyticus]|uniref:Fungal-specific transcription factor domain-containing protein n=1 Tax=Talaromyces proteolyticus TaxID=1131652 RepID=A0AAD4PVH3_9EURO|nr:fungal-specific transcription factor domain-containing protein [Talaromyces proteolyticus]KAH8690698.1 fungal-specific transcription factor domain-containing protein [Talaromyces proteolyticus]